MQLRSAAAEVWPLTVFARATSEGSRVKLAAATGEPQSVPLIWLRDNCPCAQCRVTSTGEHRYFLGAAADPPEATSVWLEAGTLTIDWRDNHQSVFRPEDLARLAGIAARAVVGAQLWADDYAPAEFDHDAVLRDRATQIEFFETTMRDGMSVVTSTPTESGECIRFLEALKIPVRETPFDRLHDVYFRADGYNVAHTDEPLPPHNDFASYQWPPSGQLIHMIVNDVVGGDWVNVDGWKILDQLRAADADAFDTLTRVPVAFREHSDTAESWARAPIVRLDHAGEICGIRFSNQLMQPLYPTGPEVEAFYRAYHLLARAICDPANQLSFRGHAGHMQVLHGHRILHARHGFQRDTGARHLQDTYFEFDDLAALSARTAGEAR